MIRKAVNLEKRCKGLQLFLFIETLGLFGSVARGEQNEKSDIDVFIKLRKTSYYTLMDIKDDLEQVFRQKVDLITLHETMRALFRRKIEQDAIYL